MVTAQLSFLLLFVVTRAWIAARRGSWMRSGAYLGIALAMKPFFLVFFPYFVCRRWRAVLGSAAMSAAWFVVGWLIFGTVAYRRWSEVLSSVQWTWAAMNGSWRGFLVRLLDASPYFTPAALAPSLADPLWISGSLAIGGYTVAISSVSRPACVDRSFASLLLAAQFMSPLGWVYYICLAVPLFVSTMLGQIDARALSRRTIGILVLAALCLVVPLPAVTAFQPSAVATAPRRLGVLLGNASPLVDGEPGGGSVGRRAA